jgi:hypothetical protein
MTYLDKIMEYLDKDALVSKLGLEPKPSAGEKMLSAVGLLGAGALLGAGVALLLARKNGREPRGKVRDAGSEMDETRTSRNDLGGSLRQPTV